MNKKWLSGTGYLHRARTTAPLGLFVTLTPQSFELRAQHGIFLHKALLLLVRPQDASSKGCCPAVRTHLRLLESEGVSRLCVRRWVKAVRARGGRGMLSATRASHKMRVALAAFWCTVLYSPSSVSLKKLQPAAASAADACSGRLQQAIRPTPARPSPTRLAPPSFLVLASSLDFVVFEILKVSKL